MVLVMLGEGRAEYKGEIMSGREAMAAAGIPTVELAAKEGLALINGTQIMTAVGCLAVYDAVQLTKTADIACAMTAEALFGIKKAYDPKVHAVRGHKGQINSAKNLLTLLEGSKLAFDTISRKGSGCICTALHPAGSRSKPRCDRIRLQCRQPRD